MITSEIVVVGAGIVGLSAARELLRRGAGKVVVLDKEEATGKHASGRNSGVLHAGIYYSPGTAKAATCLAGNRLMRAFCREHGLPLLECGKVVVAKDEQELPRLKALYERAKTSGTEVALIDEKELADIEPQAKTRGQAIFSPLTAVVDPKAILHRMLAELRADPRAEVILGARVIGPAGPGKLATSLGLVQYHRLVNAAGAFADRLAQAYGLGWRYRLVPFKGIYRELRPDTGRLVRGNIYPVPDPDTPFLGVHFTRSVSGRVYVGPTAIPALGRENYGILKGLTWEAPEILWRDAVLFAKDPTFRRLALTEPRKYSARYFLADAAKLVKNLSPLDLAPATKAGIRPQLVDTQTNSLVMDFLCLSGPAELHVLNSISPAFTSSLALAPVLADQVLALGG
jgi:L-2-hydroxyglutarate oxidase LhgO